MRTTWYQGIRGDLSGLNIAIDCANGASAVVAPKLFPGWAPSAPSWGQEPDGWNINDGCGSTHLDNLAKFVVAGGFDCGIAFDGDADEAALPATRRAARWTATRSLPCWP